jgi:hypothetical protein
MLLFKKPLVGFSNVYKVLTIRCFAGSCDLRTMRRTTVGFTSVCVCLFVYLFIYLFVRLAID